MQPQTTTFNAQEKTSAQPREIGVANDLVPPHLEAQTALFLDFDGTLVDIAARPQDVVLPDDLVDTLGRLQRMLGGALAIVTGRPLEQVDAFLKPLGLAAAGEHGAVWRTQDGRLDRAAVPDATALAAEAERFAARNPAVLYERKRFGVALHYRAAPELKGACLALAQNWIAQQPGWALLHGKAVVEIKPANVDKGRALDVLMRSQPFVGRKPLFIGDDTTDEAAIAEAQSLGGVGIKVGEGESAAHYRLGGPEQVLAYLRSNLQALAAV